MGRSASYCIHTVRDSADLAMQVGDPGEPDSAEYKPRVTCRQFRAGVEQADPQMPILFSAPAQRAAFTASASAAS